MASHCEDCYGLGPARFTVFTDGPTLAAPWLCEWWAVGSNFSPVAVLCKGRGAQEARAIGDGTPGYLPDNILFI